MRTLAVFSTLLLAMAAGCATSAGGSGGGGSGTGNGGPSTGDTGNDDGDDIGSDGNPSDDEGSDEDGADDIASDDNGPEDDGTDDIGDLPVAFRLDGTWEDNGRIVIIEQNGIEVEANYFTERYCDPENGPSDEPTPGADSTFFDFRGTLNNGEDVLPGDIITGEVITCRYGFDSGENGFVLADFTLMVVDENNMSGEYEIDEDVDGEPDGFGSFTVTRVQ